MATDEIGGTFQVAAVEMEIGTLFCVSDSRAPINQDRRTQSAVDETFKIASVGCRILGYGRSSTATWVGVHVSGSFSL